MIGFIFPGNKEHPKWKLSLWQEKTGLKPKHRRSHGNAANHNAHQLTSPAGGDIQGFTKAACVLGPFALVRFHFSTTPFHSQRAPHRNFSVGAQACWVGSPLNVTLKISSSPGTMCLHVHCVKASFLTKILNRILWRNAPVLFYFGVA